MASAETSYFIRCRAGCFTACSPSLRLDPPPSRIFFFAISDRPDDGAVQKAMDNPTIAKRPAEIGADIPPPEQRSPQALGRLVAAEVGKWVPLIKATGITAQ
jgi:hypothetical protein